MNKKIDKLTSKIMDKSNQLLEVHEYVPRSDRFSNSKWDFIFIFIILTMAAYKIMPFAKGSTHLLTL